MTSCAFGTSTPIRSNSACGNASPPLSTNRNESSRAAVDGSSAKIASIDGTNCTTNGDLICDTPADPYVVGENISNYVDVQMGCRFIYGGTDANGESYLTDVGNIMSYYPEECKCGFSYEQYQLMAENYRKADPKHW